MTEELDFIVKLEDKYEKMKNEYNEVGRNALRDKYENLQYLMQSIYSLSKFCSVIVFIVVSLNLSSNLRIYSHCNKIYERIIFNSCS